MSLNRPWYNIVLGGGEPTIHPHIFDLIAMLHERLGNKLNHVLIITNGSRNESFYEKLAEIAKTVYITLNISIHTDHVDMSHILKLIENLSSDITISFSLMFNPDKREMVYDIYATLLEYRKKYWFNMLIYLLRDGDKLDPRHTKEDFAWQEKAQNQFRDITRSVSSKFPARKAMTHPNPIFREVEENGQVKTERPQNIVADRVKGLFNFKNMYCMANATLVNVFEDGRCRGMVCLDDRCICNIYDKDCFKAVRDKLIHPVKCTRPLCGCSANYHIPKFASEEEAKIYVEFAQKRQAQLFDEFDAAHAVEKI